LEDYFLDGEYSQQQVQGVVDPEVVVENGYAVWRLTYATSGRQATATVTVPNGMEPPDGGWHVAVNMHGTAGLDDPCTLARSWAGVGLAGLFGARGLVGVAPDYPGLGTPGTVAYLVARESGRAALDAARATLAFLERTRQHASGRVAIVGLSQGGHAALSAAREHATHAPELDVRAFAASGPASAFVEHWAPGMSLQGSHVVYLALLTYSWAQHHGHDGGPLWSRALAPHVADVMTTHCLVSQDEQTLEEALGTDPAALFDDGYRAAFAAETLPGYPVIAAAFAQNRVQPFTQIAPLRIYQGTQDTVVLPAHTRAVVEALRDGGVVVDYQEVEGGTHTDIAFGFLAYPERRTQESLAWVREQLERAPAP
jgi:acetyl esterase/lipase